MTVNYGSLPFREAIQFFQEKDLIPTQSHLDLMREGHDTGFMVAGAMKADLLADFKDAVSKARTEGTTLAQFTQDFEEIVARRGWTGWTGEGSEAGRAWRAKVIYDTNLSTSYAAGRWQQVQAVKASRPYLLYQHSDASVTPRPLHVAWSGTVVRQDDPWVHTHFPPNGYGCKCRMFSLSQSDMDKRGLKPQSPPDNGTRRFVDKATGEVMDIPNGIDPGFDYTPGASLSATVRQQLERKAEGLPKPLGDALKADLAKSDSAQAIAILDGMDSIYETAKNGGDYSRHYERYKDEYLPRLIRAVKSYGKVIAEHEEWIKNPALKLGDNQSPDFIRLYTDGKWPGDIARNRAYKTIIEGIIEERKNGKPD